MFFGRELKENATYARKSDAQAAARWVARFTGKIVMLWELRTGGWHMSHDFLGKNMITVGYLAALMQRHDKPPVLDDFIGKDDKTQRRDMADVPFMSALPFYDVLPKERPA